MLPSKPTFYKKYLTFYLYAFANLQFSTAKVELLTIYLLHFYKVLNSNLNNKVIFPSTTQAFVQFSIFAGLVEGRVLKEILMF